MSTTVVIVAPSARAVPQGMPLCIVDFASALMVELGAPWVIVADERKSMATMIIAKHSKPSEKLVIS